MSNVIFKIKFRSSNLILINRITFKKLENQSIKIQKVARRSLEDLSINLTNFFFMDAPHWQKINSVDYICSRNKR